MRWKLRAAAVAVIALASSQAQAASIILNFDSSVAVGDDAYKGFTAAANFWSSRITNDITVKIDVGLASLAPNVIGNSSSKAFSSTMGLFYGGLNNSKTSAVDLTALANLPTLTSGGIDVVTAVGVLDTDLSSNNTSLAATSANLRALGYSSSIDALLAGAADARIKFSSTFEFDFDPRDGISAGKLDFTGTALHEIGHALGFVSGVDDADRTGVPSLGYVGDLFRYSDTSGFGAHVLTWAPGVESYFSADGINNQGNFSTGKINGDGSQASHWKDNLGLGIMDPTADYGEQLFVTSRDLLFFDVIGYNFDFNVLTQKTLTTGQIYAETFGSGVAAVPEPRSWALAILGLGMTGAALRRRRRAALTV